MTERNTNTLIMQAASGARDGGHESDRVDGIIAHSERKVIEGTNQILHKQICTCAWYSVQ